VPDKGKIHVTCLCIFFKILNIPKKGIREKNTPSIIGLFSKMSPS
jgi:hypothetical protein